MSQPQNIISSEITSGRQTITPSILVKSEAFAGGWSSADLTFRSRGVTTSTLLGDSFCDLWSFISARPAAPVPNVFALDNGNFRAVWKNPEGERVALEFQGSQTVGFVIFAQARSLGKMMRIAGVQTLRQVPALAYVGDRLSQSD